MGRVANPGGRIAIISDEDVETLERMYPVVKYWNHAKCGHVWARIRVKISPEITEFICRKCGLRAWQHTAKLILDKARKKRELEGFNEPEGNIDPPE